MSGAAGSACAAVWALNPHRDEISIAKQIRAASPIASPNRLIVSLADKALGREGRMLRALDEMGPGSMMVEGRPFRIDLEGCAQPTPDERKPSDADRDRPDRPHRPDPSQRAIHPHP